MELIRRPAAALAVSPPRWAERAMIATQYETLVAVERLHGAELIAGHGLRGVGRLSATEASLMDQARFGDARYREIVDHFVETVGVIQTRYALR